MNDRTSARTDPAKRLRLQRVTGGVIASYILELSERRNGGGDSGNNTGRANEPVESFRED